MYTIVDARGGPCESKTLQNIIRLHSSFMYRLSIYLMSLLCQNILAPHNRIVQGLLRSEQQVRNTVERRRLLDAILTICKYMTTGTTTILSCPKMKRAPQKSN
ncbi:hypothetical protein P5V15_002457 [Pogonomyrmex californicus]